MISYQAIGAITDRPTQKYRPTILIVLKNRFLTNVSWSTHQLIIIIIIIIISETFLSDDAPDL